MSASPGKHLPSHVREECSSPGPAVVFHCDGGSMAWRGPAPELPGVGFLRVACVGRVSLGELLRPLRMGARSVLVVGCARGGCRFHEGDEAAALRVERANQMLRRMGLGQAFPPVRYLEAGPGEVRGVVAAALESQPPPLSRGVPGARYPLREASRRIGDGAGWSHHGVVQEASLLSHLAPVRLTPAGIDPQSSAEGVLVYGCTLPWLDDALGPAFPGSAAETLGAVRALMEASGSPFIEPLLPACGHDLALWGHREAARELTRHLWDALGQAAGRLVVLCPECEASLSDPGLAPMGDPAPDVVGIVAHLGEVMDQLRFSMGAGPEPVALHLSPGHRGVPPEDTARALLAAAGFDVVASVRGCDQDAQGRSAGVRGFSCCDRRSREAQERLLGELERSGAKRIVCTSPLDAVHLGCAVRGGGWRQHSIRVESLPRALAGRLADGDRLQPSSARSGQDRG